MASNLAHGHGFAHVLPLSFRHATAARPPLFPALVSVFFHLDPLLIGWSDLVNGTEFAHERDDIARLRV